MQGKPCKTTGMMRSPTGIRYSTMFLCHPTGCSARPENHTGGDGCDRDGRRGSNLRQEVDDGIQTVFCVLFAHGWRALLQWDPLGGYSLKNYYKTSNGQLNIDKLMLKVPILGDVLRKSAVSSFTRTLGTLIS